MSRFPGVDRAVLGRPVPDRHPDDFYVTPRCAVDELLQYEDFDGTVLEPACGDGALSRVLEESPDRTVTSSDLADRGYGTPGVDFFSVTERYDHVVTNPPFRGRLPELFLHHALGVARFKVALLARVLWLEGAGRGQRVFNGHTPLRAVYVFSQRINVQRGGWQGVAGGSGARTDGRGGLAAFAWYVWEHGHTGPTVLRHLR